MKGRDEAELFFFFILFKISFFYACVLVMVSVCVW